MEDAEDRVPSLFVLPFTLFFIVLVLFTALLYGGTDLAVLSLLVMGTAGGAKLWARRSLSNVQCQGAVDRARVFPGEKLAYTIETANGKFLPVWLEVRTHVDGLLDAALGEKHLKKGAGLLWHQRAQFRWDLIAERRGVHPLGPVRLAAGDLFGFFSNEKSLNETLSVIVYPRLVPLKPFVLPRRDLFGRPGVKSPVQDPVYILGTHDYQPWHPSKYIHWKASSRHSRLQVKVFEPSAQEKVLLAVRVDEFARERAEAEFEQTLEVVASLAARLDGQGYALGLVTNGDMVGDGLGAVPVGRHPGQLSAILEVLARLRMEPKLAFLEALRGGARSLWDTSCVCFAYEDDGAGRAVEEHFGRRRVPVTSVVCHVSPPARGEGRGVRGTIHRLGEMCVR